MATDRTSAKSLEARTEAGPGLSIASMINNAASTPKVYNNHANHPGHTTAAFNKQKVSYEKAWQASQDSQSADVAKSRGLSGQARSATPSDTTPATPDMPKAWSDTPPSTSPDEMNKAWKP